MSEIKVKVPESLEKEVGKIEKEVEELILMEEKRKLLSMFIDEVMENAKQLDKGELVELGKKIKKGRFEKLRKMGYYR